MGACCHKQPIPAQAVQQQEQQLDINQAQNQQQTLLHPQQQIVNPFQNPVQPYQQSGQKITIPNAQIQTFNPNGYNQFQNGALQNGLSSSQIRGQVLPQNQQGRLVQPNLIPGQQFSNIQPQQYNPMYQVINKQSQGGLPTGMY